MPDSTPETMNVDGRPKVRGVDQGRGNLDSNTDAVNFEHCSLWVATRGVDQGQGNLDSNPNVMNFEHCSLWVATRGVDQGQGSLDCSPDAMNFEAMQSLGGNKRC
ncbi:unnamed protein product [Meganyctiphanes norvegica]|uniref:Uncharacterized protein n=1 Tax=Meganyctiphanes norvegica TaxID=48144 RepID=A0AAV2SUZ8_MEGNR